MDEETLKQLREEYKAELADIMKGKADRFDEMANHEQEIRLDQQGWKERYYTAKYPDIP